MSLTSIVCKCMEKIVRNHITSYMKENGLFSPKQYGFISGRSTILQLITILDTWTYEIDRGHHTDVIYMDFKKAFDTVPHKRLISKLNSLNISKEIVNWIEAFISNRRQKVAVNGKESNWHDVTSGIPQGTVLGPLLFVLYINDLPDLTQSDTFLFADDIKIFRSIINTNDQDILQQDITTIEKLSHDWMLTLHPDKCTHMEIGKNNVGENQYYTTMNNVTTTIDTHDKQKDLGVTFDSKLTFDQHISQVVNEATKMTKIIRRSFQFLDKHTFLPLYKTMVRTHLDYAMAVWHPYKIKHKIALENIQRRATKELPGMRDLSYIERLKLLKLPTLGYRRLRGDMIEVYKIIHNIYDHESVPHLLKNNEISQRTGNRGHSLKLFIQRAKLNLRKNVFPIRITEPWNSLPDTVVTAKSLNSFKIRLDKFWYNQDIVYDFEAPLRITNNRTGTRDLILIDNENEELITEEHTILRLEPS